MSNNKLLNLVNIDSLLPSSLSANDKARLKTAFFKELALASHELYQGKLQTLPSCGLYGLNWFNSWYTPGVSAISTTIRDNNERSFDLSMRGRTVAVVSDSTRVLGDGDCSPPGGMGVMEGKALLMKYLGGFDAVPLCIDSRDSRGEHDPQKIIDFVKMCQHSFGAINLEDISQPNCYRVLDELRDSCDIPVWHDDAQGTACVTIAALLNALHLAEKKIADVKIVLLGAGAANSTIARLLLQEGALASNIIIFDERGSLHSGRTDFQRDRRYYRQWELCLVTNPRKITDHIEAFDNADVLIALSKPGPDTVKPAWIARMAPRSIVFTCANPVPEIWPHEAKAAGAFIVATGRGDFPNQVNNSLCFPGILKGVLAVHARKISDSMVSCCAHTIADYALAKGIDAEHIIPSMDDTELFALEAANVAQQAIIEGHARKILSFDAVLEVAKKDIAQAKAMSQALMDRGFIPEPPESLIRDCLQRALSKVQ